MEENTDATDRESRRMDGVYLAAVGALLVVICAALATLWWVERGHRTAAEAQARNLRAKLRQYEQFQKLGGPSLLSLAGVPPATQPGPEPVRRDQLTVQTVEFAGKSREVLLIPADVGQRLGFQVDDLILVSRPPRPRPPDKPATAPARDGPKGSDPGAMGTPKATRGP